MRTTTHVCHRRGEICPTDGLGEECSIRTHHLAVVFAVLCHVLGLQFTETARKTSGWEHMSAVITFLKDARQQIDPRRPNSTDQSGTYDA